MCCTRLAENTRRQKSPFWHHRTTLSGYIFGTKACIDNRKNLLSSNISSTCPHNMVNFGPLTAEICWRVCGTPANFNGFRLLAALVHSTVVVGVSQTLRRWTEGATYIRQGGHHVGHWPTFKLFILGYILLIVLFHLILLCPSYVIRQAIIFCPVVSFFFLLLSFSSPNLSGRKLDVYHTSTHMVWPLCKFRMQVRIVLHAARWKYRTQKIAILAPSHNFVGLYLRN